MANIRIDKKEIIQGLNAGCIAAGGMLNHHVFILGAGFSKAINSKYPTLKELSKSVNERFLRLVNDQSGYFDKATTCIANYYFSIPKQIRDNFENLLTYLNSTFPWKTDVEVNLDKALYLDILKQLSRELQYLPEQFDNKWLKLGTFINKAEATCLTFNYDLLLEKLLCNTSLTNNVNKEYERIVDYKYKNYYKVNFENFDVVNYLSHEDISEPSIFKLHGSINWIYKSNSLPDKILFNGRTNNYSVPEGYSPYIVPPVNDKTSFYNNSYLNQLWYSAKESLAMADNIYIIGYSFPKTDLSSEFLMKFALQSEWYNKDLKRNIYYVNLKENSSLISLCNDYNVKLKQITCKDCTYYKRAGMSSDCKQCKKTPLDKFIKTIINKKLKEDTANEI